MSYPSAERLLRNDRREKHLPSFVLPCPFGLLDQIGAGCRHRADTGRLLLELARHLGRDRMFAKARLMMVIDRVALPDVVRAQLEVAAAAMTAGALHRLSATAAPELFVVLHERAGEIHLSMIDNSGIAVGEAEAALVQQLIVPLGGLHDRERAGPLVESTFSFLVAVSCGRRSERRQRALARVPPPTVS